MPSWRLIDADIIALEHKYTFYKPSRELIRQLKPGEIVKLIFEFDSDDPEMPRAERMWVQVDEIDELGGFKGRLNNKPMYIKDIKLDDPVQFQACHIISTAHNHQDDQENLVERYIKRCDVTHRILYDRQKVGYLYREDPSDEDDSGWAFTANDESDEYMDTSANVAYVSLGAVLSKDDSFITLLDSPVSSAFVRDASTGQFVPEVKAG